jgi:hypothetical protein
MIKTFKILSSKGQLGTGKRTGGGDYFAENPYASFAVSFEIRKCSF